MSHPLEGVYNKIIRAEEHFASVKAEIARQRAQMSSRGQKRPPMGKWFDSSQTCHSSRLFLALLSEIA